MKSDKFPYRDEGSDQAVLLLHGFLEQKDMWDWLFEMRPRGYRFIAPDLPGHGLNSDQREILDLGVLAKELDHFLKELKIEQVILLGHSMGGYLATAYFHQFPEKVRGLVLFHSSAAEDDEEKKLNRLRAIEAVQKNKSLYCTTMIRSLFRQESLRTYEPVLVDLIRKGAGMETEAIVASLKGMRQRPDYREFLSRYPQKVAYILGDSDARLPLEAMQKEIAQVDPDFIEVIDECGHLGQWEKPEEAGRLLMKAIRHFG